MNGAGALEKWMFKGKRREGRTIEGRGRTAGRPYH